MKQSLGLIIFAFVVVASGFTLAPTNAEASCSANGYFHSGGRCGVSFKNYDDDDDDEGDDDDDDGYKWKNKNWENKKHKGGGNYYGGYGDIEYLRVYIDRLLALLALYDQNGGNASSNDIDVTTLSATSIDEDSATLRARVEMNDENEGELYFQYGTSAGNLGKKTSVETLDDTDDGDTIEISVTGLEDNTRYYFRAVAVDENGDKDYGVTYSFVTDDNSGNNDEDPTVTTQSATNIDSDSADLRGTVDMNDFENGVAFFVYGEDESQIDDVEDDFTSYSDVDEDGDDLRKVQVDSDVDGTESYTRNVDSLDGNTNIYYALCVAYKDEDNDDTLECGSTKTFETN